MSTALSELREDRQRRIEALSRAGYTVKQISAELGVCTYTVVAARKRAGIGYASPRRFKPHDLVRIAALLADGCSYAEVARTTGFRRQSIAKKFPGRGWDMGTRDAHSALIRNDRQRPRLGTRPRPQ